MRELLPSLVRLRVDAATLRDSVEYLAWAEQFSLCVSMAAAKATADAAGGIAHSTIVTTLARNGVDFGIRVSGLGDTWFTAPANPVDGLLFSSEWGEKDTVSDMGDSSIMETVGLGGYVQVAAPVLQQFVGGSFQRAVQLCEEMRQITAGVLPDYRISESRLRCGTGRYRYPSCRADGNRTDHRHRHRPQEGGRNRRWPDTRTNGLFQQSSGRVLR